MVFKVEVQVGEVVEFLWLGIATLSTRKISGLAETHRLPRGDTSKPNWAQTYPL
jgi:hypothetical protein